MTQDELTAAIAAANAELTAAQEAFAAAQGADAGIWVMP